MENVLGIDSGISIHALLAESDQAISVSNSNLIVISIHALLAESDYGGELCVTGKKVFLSTLSLRRATLAFWYSRCSR